MFGQQIGERLHYLVYKTHPILHNLPVFCFHNTVFFHHMMNSVKLLVKTFSQFT